MAIAHGHLGLCHSRYRGAAGLVGRAQAEEWRRLGQQQRTPLTSEIGWEGSAAEREPLTSTAAMARVHGAQSFGVLPNQPARAWDDGGVVSGEGGGSLQQQQAGRKE
jgi:hypothetical protein